MGLSSWIYSRGRIARGWGAKGRKRRAQQRSDRRGRTRVAAFEPLEVRQMLSGTTIVVNTLVDTLSHPGLISLRDAVNAAGASSAANPCTIDFDPSLFPAGVQEQITLSQGAIGLSNAYVSIDGPGAGSLVITASSGNRVFQTNYGNVAFSGLTISGGKPGGNTNGSAIFQDFGIVTVQNCVIANNVGNAWYVNGDSTDIGGTVLNVIDSTITHNGGGNYGGGIFAYYCTLNVTGTTISDNSAIYGGGGITAVYDNVNLIASTLSGNTAHQRGGAIYGYNMYSLNVKDSTISGNLVETTYSGKTSYTGVGGGIFAEGAKAATVVTNSIIDGNKAANGGGILSSAPLTVTGSTISNNCAMFGGGLYNEESSLVVADDLLLNNKATQYGGGIDSFDGTTSVTNSTLTGNTAAEGGGIYNNSATLTAVNDTIVANSANRGGGLSTNGPTVNLLNSIIAKNTVGGQGTAFYADVAGSVASAGNNLIGIADGSDGWVASDLTGSVAAALDPLLAPLGNNGGPTQTIALQTGSPAIDGGAASGSAGGVTLTAPETDQRSVERGPAGVNAGNAPDIGAYEVSSSFIVTSTDDTLDLGTLRSGMAWAVVGTPPGTAPATIRFDPGLVANGPATIDLTTFTNDGTSFGPAAFVVTGNVRIEGPATGNSGVTIARTSAVGTPDFRLFTVAAGASLELDNLTLSGGVAAGASGGNPGGGGAAGMGGAIFNEGRLTLVGSTLSGNTAVGGQGGAGAPGTAGGGFGGGAADAAGGGGGAGLGGAVYNDASPLVFIINSTFAGNTAQGGLDGGGNPSGLGLGGAVFSLNGMTLIFSSTVSGNTAFQNAVDVVGYGAGQSAMLGIHNTIIANSILGDPNGTDISVSAAAFGHAGASVSGDLFTTYNIPPYTKGVVSTANPNLGPLAPNGGPTETFALLPGSPAIDAGIFAGTEYQYYTTDQRGLARSVNNTIDIGAYEVQPPTETINQAAKQADPTSASPIHFTVVFSEPVKDFVTANAAADVLLGGTAGANPADTAITNSDGGSDLVFDVAVSGMTADGTVTATIPAGVVHDSANNLLNAAATSTDNQVTCDLPLVIDALSVQATEGVPLGSSAVVAQFTDPDPNAMASYFSGTIYWRDGSATPSTTFTSGDGTVVFDSASATFQVTADHTFTEGGTYWPEVVIHDPSGCVYDAQSTTLHVADPAPTMINTGATVAEGATVTIAGASSDPSAPTMLRATDDDDSPWNVAYTLTSLPTAGTLNYYGYPAVVGQQFTQGNLDSSGLTYVSDPGQDVSSDSFGFTVGDSAVGAGNEGLASGTFTITITDEPATLTPVQLSTTEDSTVSMAAADLLAAANPVGFDAADNPSVLSVSPVTTGPNPTQGAVSLDGTTVTYNPAGGFESLQVGQPAASDTFQYTLDDGNGHQVTGMVVVTVSPPTGTLAAGTDSLATNEDAVLAVRASDLGITGLDAGDSLTLISIRPTTKDGATITLNKDGTLTYDPSGVVGFESMPYNQTAWDAFGYTAQDNHGRQVSGTAIVTVSVPASDAPLAETISMSASEGSIASISVADFLAQSQGGSLGSDDTLSLSLPTPVSAPRNAVTPVSGTTTGTPSISGESLLYDPGTGFENAEVNGTASDSFQYMVENGHGQFNIGTVTVTIADPPPVIAANSAMTVIAGATATITSSQLLATSTGDDDGALMYTLTALPAHGALQLGGSSLGLNSTFTQADIGNNQLRYVNDAGGATSDSFGFNVCDEPNGLGTSNQTFAIVVSGNHLTLAADTGVTLTEGGGYWLVAADGGIFPFGDAQGFGSVSNIKLNKPIVGMEATPDGGGYWLVASDGGIFPFGDAQGFGSTGNLKLNKPIVGMEATPDGGGYWLVASDGGIFPFGDAHGFGSTGNIKLNKPIVGMEATPDGGGYWLVASDGGIFPFGDAQGFGSTGNIKLNKPIVGMEATPDGKGYWLVASDGGIFPFGDAQGLGSTGNLKLKKPIVGMQATPDGGGNWLVASDGGIFPFGDAHALGSTANLKLNKPIVGMEAGGEGGKTITSSMLSVTDSSAAVLSSGLVFALTTAPTQGTLRCGTVALHAGSTFTQDDINQDRLTFASNNGDASDSFAFTVTDGTISGTTGGSFAITIDDPPTIVANAGLTLNEAATATITSRLLQATDDPLGTLVYKVVAAPNVGTLRLGAAVLAAGSTFTQADINAGRISYQNLDDRDSAAADSFSFIVSDGAKPGGVSANFIIHVTELAVTPVGTKTLSAQATVGASLQTATFTDPAGPESAVEYAASINWGDKSPVTLGTIGLAAGSTTTFTVTGSHKYAKTGHFTITTTITHFGTTSSVKSTVTVGKPIVVFALAAPLSFNAPATAGVGSAPASSDLEKPALVKSRAAMGPMMGPAVATKTLHQQIVDRLMLDFADFLSPNVRI